MDKYHLIILFPFLISVITSNILEISLYKFECDIEIQNTIQKFGISIQSNSTIFKQPNINNDDEPLFSDQKKIICEDTSSKLIISKGNTPNIPFKLTFESGAYNQLTFGKNINKDFSIVYQLYNKGIIKNKSFSFNSIDLRSETSILHLGGISQSYTKGKYKIKLPTEDYGYKWAFQINSISNGPVKLNVNKLGILGTTLGNIIVDQSMFNFIKKNILKEAFENHLCEEFIWDYEDGANIICDKKGIPELPILYFYVNNGKDIIPMTLNYSFINEKYIDISYNTYLDDKNFIWLEKSFLQQHNMLFDYNDNSISLYVNKNLINNNKFYLLEKNKQIVKKMIYFNVIILILTLIFICLNRNNKY
jgi:hypothetical protein